MHILFLSDNFIPEVNAPAARTYEHCREWVKRGHEVTVITCVPNFPNGKVFEGFKNKVWQIDYIDGIRVLRVWSYIAPNQGFKKRLLDFLSFMITSFIAAFFVRNVNVVIGTSPQFFTVVSAFSIAQMKRVPFVFELRDLWPASIRALGAVRESVLLRLMDKLEIFLYQRATIIISVTHAFKNNLIERGISASKIKVVTNGVARDFVFSDTNVNKPIQNTDFHDTFVVGYIGTIGMAHSLETLVHAAEYLTLHHPQEKVLIFIMGDGANKKKLMDIAGKLSLKNIVFWDSVGRAEVAKYWALCNASIIHLKKDKLFETVIPSKLFESLAMGVPTVLGVSGESAELVRSTNTGIIIEPENHIALAKAILKLKENPKLLHVMKENCIFAAKSYERENLAKQMLGEIERVIRR